MIRQCYLIGDPEIEAIITYIGVHAGPMQSDARSEEFLSTKHDFCLLHKTPGIGHIFKTAHRGL